MLVTVGITTVVWLSVTFLTGAEPIEKLVAFYRKVQPEGPGWSKIAASAGLQRSTASGGLTVQFANWFLGCVLIYAFLFGIGYVIFGEMLKGAACLLGGVTAGALIMRNLQHASWQPAAADTPEVGQAVSEA
jgi:hypothetical protein